MGLRLVLLLGGQFVFACGVVISCPWCGMKSSFAPVSDSICRKNWGKKKRNTRELLTCISFSFGMLGFEVVASTLCASSRAFVRSAIKHRRRGTKETFSETCVKGIFLRLPKRPTGVVCGCFGRRRREKAKTHVLQGGLPRDEPGCARRPTQTKKKQQSRKQSKEIIRS